MVLKNSAVVPILSMRAYVLRATSDVRSISSTTLSMPAFAISSAAAGVAAVFAIGSERTATLKASVLSDDAILSIARRAGMLVMLDGRIGRETYQSVTGSL